MVLYLMKYIYWYLIILNVTGVIFYAYDKVQAMRRHHRIRERTLLLIAISGVVFGCILGMYVFHHKTLKWKFHLCHLVFLIIWVYCLGRFFF